MLRSAAASFLGSHTNRIDAKGRVAAPADFRRALDLTAFNGFFCVPSVREAKLDCGGPDYIENLKLMIGRLRPFSAERRALERTILGRAKPISFDADGRFIIPKELREHAGIEGEACFVGLGDTFEIRSSGAFSDELSNLTEIAADALELLENPFPDAVGDGQ